MKLKVVDIDNIFDSFLVKYINDNKGKLSEKEWEEKIPLLYLDFGDTALDELDGKTPDEYYKEATAEELSQLLKEHVETGVAVSDYLCEALISSDCENAVAKFVDYGYNEELISYCVNILNDKKSVIAFDKYFELLLSDDVGEDLKELLAEMLATYPEYSKEKALSLFDKAGSSAIYFLEIFSLCKHDDRVLAILINELKTHLDDIPLYLTYVTRYGDEKALPDLLEIIENPNINYVDFRELKFAIELFGGEYKEKRDFSGDKYYKKLKVAKDESANN